MPGSIKICTAPAFSSANTKAMKSIPGRTNSAILVPGSTPKSVNPAAIAEVSASSSANDSVRYRRPPIARVFPTARFRADSAIATASGIVRAIAVSRAATFTTRASASLGIVVIVVEEKLIARHAPTRSENCICTIGTSGRPIMSRTGRARNHRRFAAVMAGH